MGWKNILLDVKTYLSIQIKNRKRFPESIVLSYISKNTTLSKKVTIKSGVLLSNKIKSIGYGTYIGDRVSIFNCSTIGNYCSISHSVKIGLDNHELNSITTSPLLTEKQNKSKPTVIEHDVLISANVTVLSGITIGTGSIIGAGSFVNKDIPPYAIVAGSPAKIIRYRYENDIVLKLIKSKWWVYDQNDLLKLQNYFKSPEIFVDKINDLDV